jgi:hypothetical protein
MTAQEHGLMQIGAAVRAMVPPNLEAVIIVYPPGRPMAISSVMATTSPTPGQEQGAALARARAAAMCANWLRSLRRFWVALIASMTIMRLALRLMLESCLW